MPKRLVVLSGPDEGRIFPLSATDTLLLGRSRATETRLIDPHVSRVHCQVQPEGEQFVLNDFESAGGTYVNGKTISRHVLKAGDLIRIGNTRMQFMDEDAAADPATPVPAAPPLAKPAGPSRDWANELTGKKFIHYKVGSILARSKHGFVFHARDLRKNLPLVLKVLDPVWMQKPQSVQRFQRAMKTVLPLRHPNLLRFLGAGKTGPFCWFAAEYVPGESLAAVIGRIQITGLPDWRNVVRFGILLSRALEYAHGKNLLHQSVTPQNILLGHDIKDTRLTDLMLAKALEDDPTRPAPGSGEIPDELPYLSPERTDGPGRTVDARTDIYSLGATMFTMLSGRTPFQADTIPDLIWKIRLEAPVSLKTMHLGVPDGLDPLLQRMLAKRPEDRFASASELRQTLESLAVAHKLTV